MKHMRLFSLIVMAIFVFAMQSPIDAAAKSGKSVAEKQVSKKKSSSRSEKKKTVREKSQEKLSVSERDVWLKRAQDKYSELLKGKASWYGKDWHNRKTASGLAYDMYTFTAAHRTLPMGTVVKVTDQENGKSVMVCVTDRGPFVRGRVIDLSYAAAKQLDLYDRGVSRVKLEVVSDERGAPLKSDQAFFVSYPSGNGQAKVGPFKAFADVAAIHEALSKAHPDAQVILDSEKAGDAGRTVSNASAEKLKQ